MRESLLEHLQAWPVPGHPAAPLRLHAFAWDRDQIEEGALESPDGRWWWIVDGVPRLLPPSLYRHPEMEERYAPRLSKLSLTPPPPTSRRRRSSLEARTIDRFGAEWIRFKDWGHVERMPEGADPRDWQGGLWENTLSAFRSKTFLAQRVQDKLVLDAGCGNGRFVAAALHHGARQVIGVDLGWGADMAHQRFQHDPRVHIVQASLFELPIRTVDVAFSLGVLMHTGDARRALQSVAATVREGGMFAVRMYHRGNWAYEFTDGAIRSITARLPKAAQLAFARAMAGFGRALLAAEAARPSRQGLRMKCYQVLRNWPTVHHNLDWWSAPVATHHTAPQVEAWMRDIGLTTLRSEPPATNARFGFWEWPEALTLLAQRPLRAPTLEPDPQTSVPQPADRVQAPLLIGR